MSFISRYVRRYPGKYTDLQMSIRSARMDMHYSTFYEKAVSYGVQTYILMFIFFFLTPYMFLTPYFSILEPYRSIIVSDLVLAVVPLVFGFSVFRLYLMYPSFTAKSRKTKIDMVLPYAASFCFGMSKGGSSIYEIFKELMKNPHIYGEIATEASYVVRDVDMMGKDLVTALKNTASVSPSPVFKDFLENLIPMMEGGSNIHHYFEIKTNQYFEHARKTQEMFLKTLELISEVYVVAFVAVPIFLLITLVTIGLLNLEQAPYLFQALYIGLPVGSIALIILLDSISPKEDLGMRYVEKVVLRKSMSIDEEEINENEYATKLKFYNKKKLYKKILKQLKNPLEPILREPLKASVISIPLMLIPFIYLDLGINKQILISAILALLPVAAAYEYKMRTLAKLDKAVPDFLRRLAEINEMGLTLNNAIGMLLKSDVGRLSGEINRVWLDMEWGGEMKDALVRFENRIGTPSLRRAVTLIVNASLVSEDTRDVLLIAAEDAENMLSLRKQRLETSIIYIATVYLAFGTFLYVCYSFSTQFLPSVTSLGGQNLLDVEHIKTTMFNTCGILGFFSGLILGEMAEGSVLHGLKHSILCLLLTYASFTMLMGY
ncbi:type II secretion system F family protein [Methanococcoides sp. AM1]|uniref:type II secretion system F family protein n=1 Tax=Methanococcoides sp. AM1 TaxID=1201011 RepID=UPI0014382E62|nr:type II secretion system F family protein [Methanococcoides sp. AM1]